MCSCKGISRGSNVKYIDANPLRNADNEPQKRLLAVVQARRNERSIGHLDAHLALQVSAAEDLAIHVVIGIRASIPAISY